jgi:hypothetical protein
VLLGRANLLPSTRDGTDTLRSRAERVSESYVFGDIARSYCRRHLQRPSVEITSIIGTCSFPWTLSGILRYSPACVGKVNSWKVVCRMLYSICSNAPETKLEGR